MSGLVAYHPIERGQSTHLHDAALDNPGEINGAVWDIDTPFNDHSLDFKNGDYNVDIDGVTVGDVWTLTV